MGADPLAAARTPRASLSPTGQGSSRAGVSHAGRGLDRPGLCCEDARWPGPGVWSPEAPTNAEQSGSGLASAAGREQFPWAGFPRARPVTRSHFCSTLRRSSEVSRARWRCRPMLSRSRRSPAPTAKLLRACVPRHTCACFSQAVRSLAADSPASGGRAAGLTQTTGNVGLHFISYFYPSG